MIIQSDELKCLTDVVVDYGDIDAVFLITGC